ncbi:hypothetical protein, partial [Hyphomicrobium sp.]|uniref:hypothetical protein n=1 Tax=Hyphomicrobium sp. TaxID=82 RepID=UPI0025BA4D49
RRLSHSLPPKTALVAGTNHQVSEAVLGLICEAAEDDDGKGKGWRHFMFLADHTSLVISKGGRHPQDQQPADPNPPGLDGRRRPARAPWP